MIEDLVGLIANLYEHVLNFSVDAFARIHTLNYAHFLTDQSDKTACIKRGWISESLFLDYRLKIELKVSER